MIEVNKLKQMRLLVVSHKRLYCHAGVFYTTGGTPLEYKVLADLFEDIHVLNNVTKCSSKPQGMETLDGRLQIHRILRRSYGIFPLAVFGFVKSAIQMFLLVKRHHIDVVWAKGVSQENAGAIWAAIIAGVPSILRLQGYEFSRYCGENEQENSFGGTTHYRNRKKWLLKLVTRYCTKVSFVSSPQAGSLDEIEMKRSQRICQMPFPNPSVTKEYLEVPPLKTTTQQKEIIFVGRLVRAKNLHMLLDVFACLLKRLNSPTWLRLRLVGDGYLRTELESHARDLHIADYVRFAGHVPRNEVWQYLANSWVFALSSMHEGSPKALIEAMAAARPVVASRVGGITALVEDGLTGYLVNPDNVDDFAEKLERVLTDDNLAIEMGIRGRERAKNYDIRAFQNNVARLIGEALDLYDKNRKEFQV